MRDGGLADVEETTFSIPLFETPSRPETAVSNEFKQYETSLNADTWMQLATKIVQKLPAAMSTVWARLGEGLYSKEEQDRYPHVLNQRGSIQFRLTLTHLLGEVYTDKDREYRAIQATSVGLRIATSPSQMAILAPQLCLPMTFMPVLLRWRKEERPIRKMKESQG